MDIIIFTKIQLDSFKIQFLEVIECEQYYPITLYNTCNWLNKMDNYTNYIADQKTRDEFYEEFSNLDIYLPNSQTEPFFSIEGFIEFCEKINTTESMFIKTYFTEFLTNYKDPRVNNVVLHKKIKKMQTEMSLLRKDIEYLMRGDYRK